MSLVPYSSHERNDVVLRHSSALVVYDKGQKQLALRAPPASPPLEYTECPYCHRPMQDYGRENPPTAAAEEPQEAGEGFVSPEYFRMLQDREGSPRRLAQPIEPGTAGHSGISAAAFCIDYFRKFFVEERVLGRGGRGIVLLVKHVLDGVSLGYFACKRVPVGDDHAWLEKVLVEVQLLQHLSHQNLVSYRHVWLEDAQLSPFSPSVPCAFILQQYCNAGDLHNYILPSNTDIQDPIKLKERLRRRSRGQAAPGETVEPRRLGFDEIYSFFKDVTSGLAHLHKHGFIHRDLKPSNCLLHRSGPPGSDIRVLVSDFGEAQKESAARRSSGATGTISYCAPEVLKPAYEGGPLQDFTTKSDVFSLGMILFFMCFAHLPYSNADVTEENEDIDMLKSEIRTWQGFDDRKKGRADLPDQLYRYLKRLLSLDPTERPSAEEILRGIRSGAVLNNESARRGSFAEQRRSSTTSIGVEAAPQRKSEPRISVADTPPPQNRITPQKDALPESSLQKETTTFQGQDDASLILRNDTNTPPDHLLTSPPRSQRRIWTRSVPISIRLLIFASKLVSLSQPCAPLAATPWLAYPLTSLAVVDLAPVDTQLINGLAVTLFLVAVHIAVVYVAIAQRRLCALPQHDVF